MNEYFISFTQNTKLVTQKQCWEKSKR